MEEQAHRAIGEDLRNHSTMIHRLVRDSNSDRLFPVSKNLRKTASQSFLSICVHDRAIVDFCFNHE